MHSLGQSGTRTSSCTARCSRQSTRRSVVVRATAQQRDEIVSRRSLVAGLAAVGIVLSGRPAQAAETFLKSTGGRGILSEEEEILYNLRKEKEGNAMRILQEDRAIFEKESRLSQEGKLCATPFGVDVVGITEAIALLGALVGGISARQRKDELERLNEQLRKINLQLRQQARAGTIYAPGLTYAPPAGDVGTMRGGLVMPPKPVAEAPIAAAIAAAAATATVPSPAVKSIGSTLLSMEEDDMSSDQVACREALRAGKRLLKEKNGSASMVRFEKALMLSKALADRVQERRANRGLAAAARLQGQYKAAIKHLERVLDISREMKEYTGDADAYGTIADCYTDMGEFEKAATFYDKYISVMNSDGVPV